MSIIQEALRKSQNSYLKNKERQKISLSTQKAPIQKSGFRFKFGPLQKIRLLKVSLLLIISGMIIISMFFLASFFSNSKFLTKEKNIARTVLPEDESPAAATDMTLSEPPQQPKVDTTLPSQPANPELVLNGIMYLDENKPQAVINGYILEEGDTINGATVMLIDKDYVLMNSSDSKVKLRLNK